VNDPTCQCEAISHSAIGPVDDAEPLVRVITDNHIRPNLKLKPTAFSLSDIQTNGFSLIRWSFVTVAEFSEISDNIRIRGKARQVVGALLAKTEKIRSHFNDDDSKCFCVIDDPVIGEEGLIDNPAHAIALSSIEVDRDDAKELRDLLLSCFSAANYINDLPRAAAT
jgi:hypothetical protein